MFLFCYHFLTFPLGHTVQSLRGHLKGAGHFTVRFVFNSKTCKCNQLRETLLYHSCNRNVSIYALNVFYVNYLTVNKNKPSLCRHPKVLLLGATILDVMSAAFFFIYLFLLLISSPKSHLVNTAESAFQVVRM